MVLLWISVKRSDEDHRVSEVWNKSSDKSIIMKNSALVSEISNINIHMGVVCKKIINSKK